MVNGCTCPDGLLPALYGFPTFRRTTIKKHFRQNATATISSTQKKEFHIVLLAITIDLLK
jgi:hypothetical protein